MRISVGPLLASTGDPTAVSAPVPEFTENTEMLLETVFVTSRYCPDGSSTIARGPEPAGVGVPLIVSVPSLAMLNTEIVFAPEFATKRNFFDECNASPVGLAFSTGGVSAATAMAPVVSVIFSSPTDPVCGSVT